MNNLNKKKSLEIEIFIVGGGGHAASCMSAISSTGKYNIVGFTDINKGALLSKLGLKHYGTDEQFSNLIKAGYSAAIGLGQILNPNLRINTFTKLKKLNAKLPTIIASSAYVSPGAKIDEASIIFHKSVVNIDAQIGKNCIINTSSVIEHGCRIGSHTHVGPGSIILGDAHIGSNCFIGSGSIIFQNINIPDDKVIPAGSIVKHSP
ncbi:NeuD/PglB/VioB family sugar acetyltransferase [Alphaproteobacteria bacterium]|nr:NeuD/PglB/VioB family sugar acetyltransferase [Alphaproteobacteria bacterium]